MGQCGWGDEAEQQGEAGCFHGASHLIPRKESKAFFFEKKKQETFTPWARHPRLEHFQPDRNRPSEAGGPRLIQMLYKQKAGAAGRMSTIFQTG
jgi:hypothetical protein